MDEKELIFTLAKLLIAVAWADGEMTNEELNCLKDLLFHLPEADPDLHIQTSAQDWAQLELYMTSPIDDAERNRLLQQLKSYLRTPAQKKLALNAIDNLIHADGEVSESEMALATEIKATIESVDTGLLAQLGGLLRGALGRRATAVAQTANREKQFDDFVKNRVYYSLQQRLKATGKQLTLTDETLRKYSLAGGLLARIAAIDGHIAPSERAYIEQALQAHWQLPDDAAQLITEVALSETAAELDFYRLTRRFATKTSIDERLHFLDVLFALAAADGHGHHDEIEEIRLIARGLNLTHPQFIAAKVKIPRDLRDS